MQIQIKRFDQSLPLPAYKSSEAAALDLCARLDMTIEAGQFGYVPLNVALQIPENCFVLLSARSSLHKKGLMMANGIGIGDSDYRGDNDEYMAALYNFRAEPVQIEKGERLVQMMVLERPVLELLERVSFNSEDRGGFGSTGKK